MSPYFFRASSANNKFTRFGVPDDSPNPPLLAARVGHRRPGTTRPGRAAATIQPPDADKDATGPRSHGMPCAPSLRQKNCSQFCCSRPNSERFQKRQMMKTSLKRVWKNILKIELRSRGFLLRNRAPQASRPGSRLNR